MTVPVASRIQTYPNATGIGPFSYSFPVATTNALVPYISVTKVDALGNRTALAYPGGYTFTLVQNGQGGGTVSPVVALANETLVIQGATPLSQDVAYRNQGDFFPEQHERSFDKLTFMAQETVAQSRLSLKLVPESGFVGDLLLESLVAGSVLAVNAVANRIIMGPNVTAISNAAADAAAAAASAAAAAASAAALASVTYLWCGLATGTADALVLTPATAIPSYSAGQKFRFITSANNTAQAVTVNISGRGVKNIIKDSGAGLTVGLAVTDLTAGAIAEIEYDGTNFQLVNVYPFSETVAAIAAAATLDLSLTAGDFVTVSGSTTITAITLGQGQKRTVRFTGTPLLTNGASLMLPAAANIQIAAGDIISFRRSGTVVYAESIRYMASRDVSGQNWNLNSNLDIWTRGTTVTGTLAVAGYTADQELVTQTGALGVISQQPGDGPSRYCLDVTGVASNTGLVFSRRYSDQVGRALIGGPVTITRRVKTTAAFTPTYTIESFNVANTPGAKTTRHSGAVVVNGVSGAALTIGWNTLTVTISALDAACANGFEVSFLCGAQTTGSRSVGWSKLEAGFASSAFVARRESEEAHECGFYVRRLRVGATDFTSNTQAVLQMVQMPKMFKTVAVSLIADVENVNTASGAPTITVQTDSTFRARKDAVSATGQTTQWSSDVLVVAEI